MFPQIDKARNFYLLVGTYTEPGNGSGEGIYCYRFDPSIGNLTFNGVTKSAANPSFLAIHPLGKFLYAVNEVKSFVDQPGGGVSSFSIDPASGELILLNQQPSHGEEPCYISIEQTGGYALVANYTSGSVALFPIQPGGELGPATQVIQETGSGIISDRQDGPHAHCFVADPQNKFAIEANLGIDRLMVYRMDLDQGKLHKHAEVQVQAGSGPRHVTFHPNSHFMYLINELNNTLAVYRYQAGTLIELQVTSTLPAGFRGKNTGADVHVSPDGRYLYCSNRGHDSIACFRIDRNTGTLTYQSHIPSGGKEPRNFAIDPTGAYLFAANQKSNNVVIFTIDPETGILSNTGNGIEVSTPVCLKFASLLP